jgi:hypothetical protein
MLKPLAASALAAICLTLTSPLPALADGSQGSVQCQGSSCHLFAQNPGSSGSSDPHSASQAGPSTCKNNLGQQVPCSDPEFGVVGPDGCYLKPVASVGPAPVAGGRWYEKLCAGPAGVDDQGPVVWIADGQGPGGGPSSPVVLASQAERELQLPEPVIRSNPAPEAVQLVGVPVWLWVEPSVWAPVSATVVVPGVSVTATATPRLVVWRPGDGAVVRCSGPGTPYTPAADPGSGSPVCGHTYTRSSAGQPNNAFSVTATITWDVAWAGGGQQGVFPGLQTTAATVFRVAEAQAILTSS